MPSRPPPTWAPGARRGRRGLQPLPRRQRPGAGANAAAGTGRGRPLLVGAVRVALEAAAETDGLVDPLLGDVLRRRGLRPHLLARARRRPDAASPCRRPRAARGSRSAVTDDDRHACPRGTALDLGATGKAFAADLVGRSRRRHLGVPVLGRVGATSASPHPTRQDQPVVVGHSVTDLDAGGAAPACASAPAGSPPRAPRPGAGAAAAASRHHVVDPRTGRPRRAVAHRHRPGPHPAAANAATTASIVLGDAAHGWLVAATSPPGWSTTTAGVTRTARLDASGIEETS